MRIKKGDTVKVIAGKDRGKTGAVLKVFPNESRISVEGVNVYAKRTRPRKANQKGEVVNVVRPFAAANVMLVCPNCKRAVRIGVNRENGKTTRVCKKCGSLIT